MRRERDSHAWFRRPAGGNSGPVEPLGELIQSLGAQLFFAAGAEVIGWLPAQGRLGQEEAGPAFGWKPGDFAAVKGRRETGSAES